ncbi:hypothetical protein SASPL_147096 [Salvia splendens]|uniref:Chromo domain-containing protein n=1 Tax=Salvia splendens TaxID=180675 RepID=A0A8X8WEJ9_SALSN|nr:hypothetical protein SASPL_147096 [Salvia splendens]
MAEGLHVKNIVFCYGNPNNKISSELNFKIQWKGYGSEYDTWEPLGISGFNRFRNKDAPFEDPHNIQLVVYMDIVYHLKPKFAGGFLGRYAMGCLVGTCYQARIGMMAAGAYVTPLGFEANMVAYEEGHNLDLKKSLVLGDAISDLLHVGNDEGLDKIPYDSKPQTEFKCFIRPRRDEMPSYLNVKSENGEKFRNLPGVRGRPDNKVEWDPNVERKRVYFGKPLVLDYAMSFVNGSSKAVSGWFRWVRNNIILNSWEEFVSQVRLRFDPLYFADYFGAFSSLKQTSSVAAYQTDFNEIDTTIADVQPSQEDNDELMLSADVFSLHSLFSIRHPRSLHLEGSINDIVMHLFIDGGYVGNEQLTIAHLIMEDITFHVDLYVLAMHGSDVVLDVQWLQLLGTVAHNYAQLTISFS